MWRAEVCVTLKQGILDPQGKAVHGGLQALGHDTVQDARVGKYIVLTLASADRKAAAREVEAMCRRLLVNPVTEDYRYELTEVETAEARA